MNVNNSSKRIFDFSYIKEKTVTKIQGLNIISNWLNGCSERVSLIDSKLDRFEANESEEVWSICNWN